MPGECRVEWLTVAGSADAWRAIGLSGREDDDGSFFVPLMGTSLRIVSPAASGAQGIVGWALSGVEAPSEGSVDGLSTQVVAPLEPVYAHHPVGATGLDHVVVLTDDLSRTTAAVEAATGCELRRVREVGEMRQGFHRIGRGGLIVEVVSRPDLPTGPASFWGLVLNVDDLGVALELLGSSVGAAKDAVQPGRRIATLRDTAGLGLPVALMTT